MAKTAAVNPWPHAGDYPSTRAMVRAKDTQTWYPTEFCYQNATGLYQLAATDAQVVKGYFTQVQSTSTSSTDVEVAFHTADTKYLGYLSNGDADIAATRTHMGNQYAVNVGDINGLGVLTFDVADSSNVAVRITDLYWLMETSGHTASSATPALVEAQFIQTVVEAA